MVYLKKFGKKQDRVIGVDGIRITHTVVKKKGPNKQVRLVTLDIIPLRILYRNFF